MANQALRKFEAVRPLPRPIEQQPEREFAYDRDAEQALIGALLNDPLAIRRTAQFLRAEDLYDPPHLAMWEVVEAHVAARAGETAVAGITTAEVADGLRARNYLNGAGGTLYIEQTREAAAPRADVEPLARRIAQLAAERRALSGVRMTNELLDAGRVHEAADVAAVALARACADVWDEPTPLGAATPTLPAFPEGTFAADGPFGRFVPALARETQTPRDLAAMLTVAVISTAVAGKVVVQVNAGYREPVNTYGAVALPPAARKSAVHRAVTAPLLAFERDANVARAAAVDAAPENEQDAIGPPLCLFVDDATPEAVSQKLAEQGGRLAVLSAEGGDLFEMMAGRYHDAPNIGVYLRAHAGDPIRVHRIKRAPEVVYDPVLTVGVATQPNTLRTLASKQELRGRGLIARFLFAVPASNIGHRDVDAPPMPGDVRRAYAGAVRSLLEIERYPHVDDDGQPAAYPLVLSAAAQQSYRAYAARTESRLRADGGDLASLEEWGGKLVGATVRIAGLLHMADHAADATWRQPIAADAFDRAVNLAEQYLVPHARAAFDAMTDTVPIVAARKLLAWLRKARVPVFSVRDAHRAIRGKGSREEVVDPGLEVLASHGYVRPVEDEQPISRPRGGRPKGARFRVHPSLL